MTHITNRDQLIDYVIKNCKRKAIVRALEEGEIEYLGPFVFRMGPDVNVGMVLSVTNGDRTYIIEVVPRPQRLKYGIYIRQEPIDWADWAGDASGPNILWWGDNPCDYVQKYRKAIKDAAKNISDS